VWEGRLSSTRDVEWDFTDSHGRRLSPGTYFVLLEATAYRVMTRITHLD